MIELWSKEQIAEKISPEEFHRIGIFLSLQEEPEGMNVTTMDSNGSPVAWEVVKFNWVPAESVYAILRLVGRYNLLLEGFGDQDGIKLQQVFKRTRMVPVTDYVDLKTKQADPGVSSLSGLGGL